MKNLICLFLFVISLSGQSQDPDSAWMRENYEKMESYITMRDGIKLFTSIYYPKDSQKDHPILLTRTPYSSRPYGEKNWKDYWNSFRSIYLKEKYILVTQDVRGKWMSEGEFRDVRPYNPDKKRRETDEASDCWDTIEWLLENIPNNNGNVGVYGISYPGFYSTMAAASGHPALKAVSPQAPVTNWFIGDDFHHHGAFFLMDAFAFYVGRGFGLPHRGPTEREAPKFKYYSHDSYKFYLETGALQNFSNLAGDSVRFWNEMFEHPDYDDWWKARDARNATQNLKPAILWVGGEFDAEDHWGAWNSYLAAEKNNPGKDFNNLVMGPWWHGQWESNDGTHLGNIFFGSNTSLWYQENIEVPFFNYYLKGKGDISHIAEATVFITGENVWKEFDVWPPEEMSIKELNLNKNGSLSWEPPADPDGFTEYPSDPAHPVPYTEDVHFNRTRNYMVDDQRFAERRPDVATFKTEILQDDVAIAGEVVADLFASISTTDADFVVKLIDVFPDSLSFTAVDIYSTSDPEYSYPMGGYEMLVHGEVMRGRYRNSYEHPEAFVPGKIVRVKFSIGNVAHTFKRGHRIMVQIQSSWFPLVDRNPQQFIDIYHCQDEDFIRADIRIHHNREYISRILMPVLEQK